MEDWLSDALASPEGFTRQFINFIGPDDYQAIKGTVLEQIRRDEFDCFITYYKKEAEKANVKPS